LGKNAPKMTDKSDALDLMSPDFEAWVVVVDGGEVIPEDMVELEPAVEEMGRPVMAPLPEDITVVPWPADEDTSVEVIPLDVSDWLFDAPVLPDDICVLDCETEPDVTVPVPPDVSDLLATPVDEGCSVGGAVESDGADMVV
jgi:hypothetical protein